MVLQNLPLAASLCTVLEMQLSMCAGPHSHAVHVHDAWILAVTAPPCAPLEHYSPCVQDSIRLLCVTIANHGAPEYAIGSLTLELLQSEGSNWDATMIGLRALLSVVMTAPLRLAGGKKFDPAVS